MREGAAAGRVSVYIGLVCALSLCLDRADARVYTCETDTGRVVLRDVPCKKGETSRERELQPPASPAPMPEARSQSRPRPKLTETLVRDLALGLDGAFARRDWKQLQTLLAADAVFEMEFRLPEGVQIARYNLE